MSSSMQPRQSRAPQAPLRTLKNFVIKPEQIHLPLQGCRNMMLKFPTQLANIIKPTTTTTQERAEVGNYERKIGLLFQNALRELSRSKLTKLRNSTVFDTDKELMTEFVTFVHTFLKGHMALLEKLNYKASILQLLQWILITSSIDDVQIFRTCVDCWNWLTVYIYDNRDTNASPPTNERYEFYSSILTQVRRMLITRMAEPTCDKSKVERQILKEDEKDLYDVMKNTLQYLTHFDESGTTGIMIELLRNLVDGTVEWSLTSLSSLCWAIGSISGCMNDTSETKFLMTVIHQYQGGKSDKIVLASRISMMHLIGKYPQFLKSSRQSFENVVRLVFTFMKTGTERSVQDMACRTLITIAKTCGDEFLNSQIGKMGTRIEDLFARIPQIICELQSQQQVLLFYEALGYMTSAQKDFTKQEMLIHKYMDIPNNIWKKQAKHIRDVNFIQMIITPEVIQGISIMLKVNYRACLTLGDSYVIQLKHIFDDLMLVYKMMTRMLREDGTKHILTEQQFEDACCIKKEIMKLICLLISNSKDSSVFSSFINRLLVAICDDYRYHGEHLSPESLISTSEPVALLTLAEAVKKLAFSSSDIRLITTGVFPLVQFIISQDLASYPEHRTKFWILVEALSTHYFKTLSQLARKDFMKIYDSVILGIEQLTLNVDDTFLNILHQMILNFTTMTTPELKKEFLQNYYMRILSAVLHWFADGLHSSGLEILVKILHLLFTTVGENGGLTFSILPTLTKISPHPEDNVSSVKMYLHSYLEREFAKLKPQQLKSTTDGMFMMKTTSAFKEYLLSLLVVRK